LRIVVAAFTAIADVRARVAAIAVRTGVRFTGREFDGSGLETILYALLLEIAVLWATGLAVAVLWAVGVLWAVALCGAAFRPALFDILAVADWLAAVPFACDRAMPGSSMLNIASAKRAVINVPRWQFRTIKTILPGWFLCLRSGRLVRRSVHNCRAILLPDLSAFLAILLPVLRPHRKV